MLGLASLFARGTSSPSPGATLPAAVPAPGLPLAAESSLLRFRQASLSAALSQLQSRFTFGNVQAPGEDQFDILMDWAKHNPGLAAPILDKIVRYKALTDHFRGVKYVTDYRREISQLQTSIYPIVQQRPWSTFDWRNVFGERFGQAELNLVQDFQIDIGDVYLGFHYMTSRRKSEPLQGLLDGRMSPYSGVILSDAFVNAFCDKIAEFSPTVAQVLREINIAEIAGIPRWKYQLLDFLNVNTNVYSEMEDPIRFVFEKPEGPPMAQNSMLIDFDEMLRVPPPEEVAPRYIAAVHTLLQLQEQVEALSSSDFKTQFLSASQELIAELKSELVNLPQRVVEQRRQRGHSREPISNTHITAEAAAHATTEAAVQWMRFLQAAGATFSFFEEPHRNSDPQPVPIISVGSANEGPCVPLLAPPSELDFTIPQTGEPVLDPSREPVNPN
jgi:hypothetical protein